VPKYKGEPEKKQGSVLAPETPVSPLFTTPTSTSCKFWWCQSVLPSPIALLAVCLQLLVTTKPLNLVVDVKNNERTAASP